ncbi:MAG: HAMP domain-containing histidine kinase [Chloroflexi bacterium]|nr:HAMP domain-containing histidine kinase [Chloroflexota bacterium]
MGVETRTRLYISSAVLAGGVAAAAAAWAYPVAWEPPVLLWTAVVAGLVFWARLHPFKLSPQAEASMFTAPLFMGVLTLPPAFAVLAGVGGTLLAEGRLRLAPRVILFNMAVYACAASFPTLVFHPLLPGPWPESLGWPTGLPAVLVAGLALHVTNLALVAGMVTIRKGASVWKVWRETWAIDVVQEAGLLVLGYLGVLLWLQAWWSVLLLAAPVVLAYHAFRSSVIETEKAVKLAEHNANLAKRLEASLTELREAQSQLIESAKLASVGVLAAGVAHEVNNPIFAIAGRAELLLRNPEKHLKSEKAIEYVNSIHQLAGRISTIVKELLEYARPSEVFEPIKVDKALDVALDLVGKLATSKGVSVTKAYRETPAVRGVANQVQQVFVNLILNSIDATATGGSITLKCGQEGKWVKASVKDTGAGIPESALPHLFEPFFTTKEVGKGTGLGLFICRRIIAEHQGHIQVQSKEGKGTEVVVRLPVAKEADGSAPQEAVAVQSAPKVLVG